MTTLDDIAARDAQLEDLLDALDRRNIHSAGDLRRYDEQSLDISRITTGLHKWFCGTFKHRPNERPQIGWPCERGARVIAAEYLRLTEGSDRT